jgi:co-chaperonin GroES (HSP10)
MEKLIPFPELDHIRSTSPESYLGGIDRASIQYPPFKGRLLGCRVLLQRMEENITHSGRFLLPDTYKHGSVMFLVLAIGPGEWVHKKTGKFVGESRKYHLWIKPQVKPGDCVVSRHWLQAEDPRCKTWHKPEYLDNCDGSGRVIVDCRFLEVSWIQ